MKEAQNAKWVLMTPPQVADGALLTGNTYVDTLGFGYLEVLFATGTMADALGTTDAATAPILEECDTSGGSYTTIAAAALAAAIPATADNKLHKIDIDLMNSTRKRFIRVKAPFAGATDAGGIACIIGRLSKPQVGPVDATGRGLASNVIA
jgi:hypothetical protein